MESPLCKNMVTKRRWTHFSVGHKENSSTFLSIRNHRNFHILFFLLGQEELTYQLNISRTIVQLNEKNHHDLSFSQDGLVWLRWLWLQRQLVGALWPPTAANHSSIDRWYGGDELHLLNAPPSLDDGRFELLSLGLFGVVDTGWKKKKKAYEASWEWAPVPGPWAPAPAPATQTLGYK